MSSSPAPVSGFDKLCDEILVKILNYTMSSNKWPVHLERSVHRHERRTKKLEHYDRRFPSHHPPLPPITIHYPHADVGFTLNPDIAPHHAHHIVDWLVVNTTSRRIRRVGKECFFDSKSFIMTFDLPDKLQKRTFGMGLADQALALERIQSITLIDDQPERVSRWLLLTKMTKAFPKLRKCVLLLGYRLVGYEHELFESERELEEEAEKDAEAQLGKFKLRRIPTEKLDDLRELLVRLGVPGSVELKVIFGGMDWDAFVSEYYVKVIYPMLKVKERLLASKRREEAEAEGRQGREVGCK